MFTRNSIVLSNNIKTPLTATNKAIGSNGILKYSYNFDEIIRQIFSHQEQGFAYDPNDLTTLYQDAAGTIPVTAAGQPVGLMKDKSGRNNHAYQTVSASRPILKQTPILGNELVVNGDFSSGLTGWGAVGGASVSITNSAIRVLNTGGGVTEQAQQSLWSGVTKEKTYAYSVNVKEIVGTPLILVETSTASLVNRPCNSVGTYTGVFTVPSDATSLDIRLRAPTVASQYGVFDDVSVKEITGYRTDQNYLAFDGVDDSLQTANIDFTATDKVSLFAGVRKLSDASAGVVCELGPNVSAVAGTFFITAPPSASAQISVASTGTVAQFVDATNLPAPISIVASASSDITANTLIIRVNGTQRMKNTASQGGGNYGNHQLFIGRRAEAALPFNGHLYSLIGIGRLTSDSETIALEKSIAKNTGVTLNV